MITTVRRRSGTGTLNLPHLLTTKQMMTEKRKGGAHNSNVTVGLYPKVPVKVGKYALKLNAITCEVKATAIHQTFQSVKAIQRPAPCPCSVSFSSPTPASSSIRFSAKARSSGESQRVVVGKSGNTKMEITAIAMVSAPSTKKSHLVQGPSQNEYRKDQFRDSPPSCMSQHSVHTTQNPGCQEGTKGIADDTTTV